MVGEANTKAERTISEANGRSERAIADSKARAEKMVADAEALAKDTIDEANTRAGHIEADARSHADEMVAEHSVTLRATEEAEQLIRSANRDAEGLRDHADAYAIDVLDKVSGVLEKLQTSVNQGKSVLRPAPKNDDYGDSTPLNGSNAFAGEYTNGYRN